MRRSVLSAVALTVLASGTALAGDFFERKAGLWKITVSGSSTTSPQSMDLCLATDTDAVLERQEAATMRALCSKFDARRVGDTFVIDSVCQIGEHANSSHTVTTPQGDTAYRMVITSQGGTVVIQEGRWGGACPASMQTGDEILHIGSQHPRDMKINLLKTPRSP